ncbi:MAG: hypothetical protein IJN83_01025 [Clostridia bacterium]|nr:hypothetical protein [Clostridia bacterium]
MNYNKNMVEFEKLYNEIFAILSLKYFWRDYSDGYKKGESPDWYNPDSSVGIEVTQAIMQEDGEAQSVVNQYLGRQKAEIPEEILQRYSGRTYFYNDRLWAIMPEEGRKENLTACEKALYRFGKKLERLNSNYTRFETNGLYLYLHESNITDDDMRCFIQNVNEAQQDSERRFDIAFLNCVNALRVVDMKNGSWETVYIPQDALAFMRSRTEKLRHGLEWKDGTEFSLTGDSTK